MYTRGKKMAEKKQAEDVSAQEDVVEEIGEPMATKETGKVEDDKWQIMMDAITTLSRDLTKKIEKQSEKIEDVNKNQEQNTKNMKEMKEELKKNIEDGNQKQSMELSERIDSQKEEMAKKIEYGNKKQEENARDIKEMKEELIEKMDRQVELKAYVEDKVLAMEEDTIKL